MKTLQDLLQLHEKHIGSHVKKPSWAIEVHVNDTLLRSTHASGWCMDISYIDRFIFNVLRTPANRDKNSREITKIFNALDDPPKGTKHLIVLPEFPSIIIELLRSLSVQSVKKELIRQNILINHERTHSWLMIKGADWHSFVDHYMGTHFHKEWDACISALLENGTTYHKVAKDNGYDPDIIAWQATEEILARLMSIDCVAEQHKKYVATMELRKANEQLFLLYKNMKKHWMSIEHFIGWIDAAHQHTTAKCLRDGRCRPKFKKTTSQE